MTAGDGEPVREVARAKLNARLRVLGREEGGFHALETIFLRLGLADDVEVRPAQEGIELSVEHAPPEDLAGRAGCEAGGAADGGGQGSLFDDPADGREEDPADGREEDAVDGGGGPGGEGSAGGGAAAGAGGPTGRVPEGPGNLCWRAAELFYAALEREPSVALRLVKRVPAGAGLGGGSADAAAVLRALSRLHGVPLGRGRLLDLAGELGSDVPFALAGVPAALGWERGRRLLPLEPPPPRPMLLVVPDVRISTPDAYAWLDGARREEGEAAGGDGDPGKAGPAAARGDRAAILPAAAELSDWEKLLPAAGNDFEEVIFVHHPQLGWWKEELLGEGADVALLCGSGSALCGVFRDVRRRDAAADRLREGEQVQVIPTRGPV